MADTEGETPTQTTGIVRGPISRAWDGETVTLIAGGPSVTSDQIATIREAWQAGRTRVIGVNDAYRLAPWLDGLYAADPPWWACHITAVRDTRIPLLMCQDEDACHRWGLRHTAGLPPNEAASAQGLSLNPAYVHFGGNSGFQALNIAFHLGAKRIVLVGYDMHTKPEGATHWFGDHPNGLVHHRAFDSWVVHFDQAAPQLAAAGVAVTNCSPDSAIKCFDSSTISAALRRQ